MIEGIVSIISVLSATVISLINISISEKRRKHDIYHTEYYKEKQEIANTISEFMKVSSTGKIKVFLRRACAISVDETVNEFCSEIDDYNDMLTFHTFRVLAIPEIHNDFTDKILNYKNNYQDCLIYIINLKAASALEGKSEGDIQAITKTIADVEHTIEKLKEIERSISNEMQEVIIRYSNRIEDNELEYLENGRKYNWLSIYR